MEISGLDKNKNYIIKTGLTINGEGAHTPGGTFYIEEGRILALASGGHDRLCFKHPNRATTVLNLDHLTALPPLVDCHVHLALDGNVLNAARRNRAHPGEMDRQVSGVMKDILEHGILAVRDGGDRDGIALRYRDKVASGEMEGPVIRSPESALRKTGTYGAFLGPGMAMDKLDETLDRMVAKKVDLVKVIVSGVVSFKEYGRVGPTQYTAGELAAIVEGARARGLPVMAHASGDAAVRLAVEAGVHTVEHGYFTSRESLALMAERNIPWIPTVIPVAARLNKPPEHGGPDRRERLVVEKTVDRQLATISEAASMGVTLGIGTDAGAPGVRHGHGYLEELFLYSRAGLSPAGIISCATINSAGILGLDWGCLEAGRPAVLLLVDGDPRQDIAALAKVKHLFRPLQKGV
ncbi:MAG: amidohydrolase family protein [Firmicutes bacterium]|nr:amidohydrolase family protein [Bacillota bacterium]